MTENEGQLLHDLGNEFYKEYSALIQKFLDKVPAHLQNDMACNLATLSNPYSSKAKWKTDSLSQ